MNEIWFFLILLIVMNKIMLFACAVLEKRLEK